MSALDLLAAASRGKATITVKGRPFVKVDADTKILEVDADGIRAAGLRLQDIGRTKGRPLLALLSQARVANLLSERGWRVNLYAEGEKVLTLGSGVSRLTGRIGLNPLKTRKLLKALR